MECLVEVRAKVTDAHQNWGTLCVSSRKFAIPFLVISYTIFVTGKRKMFCRSKPSVKGGKPQGQSDVKVSCEYTLTSE